MTTPLALFAIFVYVLCLFPRNTFAFPLADTGCGLPSSLSCADSLSGPCCSPYGYCGSTDAYCGIGCQAEFGLCFATVTSTSGYQSTATTPSATSTSTLSSVTSRPISSVTSTISSSAAPSPTDTTVLPQNGTCPALAANGTSLLDGLFPKRGCTLKEEIQCYSLPYGGIGFASHILTYYTFIILACGRSPWQPWRMLDSWKLDLILGLLGLLITMSTSIYTAVRCHNRWQFVLIAVWKLTLSISLTAMSVHVAAVVRKAVNDEKVYYHTSGAPNTVFAGKVTSDKTSDLILWLLAYIPGILVGLPGIISLVVQTWDDHTIRIITYTFLGTWLGLSILGTMIAALVAEDETKTAVSIYLAMIFALLLCMLAPFYSDWTLGAIAGNWAGTPTSDNAVLYWLYFVGKRLPFLSI